MKPVALLLLLACVGCSTADVNAFLYGNPYGPPQPLPPPPAYRYETVKIISNPPGANIEINDEYKGTAPAEFTVMRSNQNVVVADVSFSHLDLIIRALPTMPGHCVQQKSFMNNQVVPSTIYFEMALCPQEPTVNLNVNQ